MANRFLSGMTKVENMIETENYGKAYSVDSLDNIVKWLYNISDNRSHICRYRENEEIDTTDKRWSTIDTEMSNEIVDTITANKEDKEFMNVTARLITYFRDPRNGMGERSIFRTLIAKLLDNGTYKPSNIGKFCAVLTNYGRYDDLIAIYAYLLNNNKDGHNKTILDGILTFIVKRINQDAKYVKENKPENVTLLAKWMPSINSASKETRKLALHFVNEFGMSNKTYRKMLSTIRNYLNIVETNICQNKYEQIDYSKVPSLAMTKYDDVFRNHDEYHYQSYIDALKKGETKINASVSNPVELVAKYMKRPSYSIRATDYNDIIEEQWKALPEVNISGNILPVMDLSESMYTHISKNVHSIDVSLAMGIYLSEHNTGIFKNKAFAFSDRTKIVDFTNDKSLRDKIDRVCKTQIGYSTNVENCLLTVLDIARKNKCTQSEIPNLIFITDCEFNQVSELKGNSRIDSVFETVGKEFEKYGYRLPKIVFWNTQNRSKCVPITQNDNGLILLSGYSPNVINMISSNKFDPKEAILDVIMKDEWSYSEHLWK